MDAVTTTDSGNVRVVHMHESMTDRAHAAGWRMYHNVVDGTKIALHQVPLEGFSHNLDPQGECMCGPLRQVVWSLDGDVQVFEHHALDRSYYPDDFDPLLDLPAIGEDELVPPGDDPDLPVDWDDDDDDPLVDAPI